MASRTAVIVGIVLAAWCGAARAADDPEVRPGMFSVVGLLAAAYEPGQNPGLTGQETKPAFAMAGNFQVRPHIAIGVDFNSYGQEFDSGMGGSWFLGTVSDRMDVDTQALSFQALLTANAPYLTGYAGAGIGAYRTELTVEGTLLGLSGTTVDESDTRFGRHIVLGGAVAVAPSSWFVLQFRHVVAEADFGAYTNGTIDVGGDFLFIGYQWLGGP